MESITLVELQWHDGADINLNVIIFDAIISVNIYVYLNSKHNEVNSNQ